MSNILIKDLAESVDLDREAMTAIAGGARVRTPPIYSERTTLGDSRIFNPTGLPRKPLEKAQVRSAKTGLLK
jgi:hypothetical protein